MCRYSPTVKLPGTYCMIMSLRRVILVLIYYSLQTIISLSQSPSLPVSHIHPVHFTITISIPSCIVHPPRPPKPRQSCLTPTSSSIPSYPVVNEVTQSTSPPKLIQPPPVSNTCPCTHQSAQQLLRHHQVTAPA